MIFEFFFDFMPVTKELYANIKNYMEILKSDGSEVKKLYSKSTYNFEYYLSFLI